MKIVGFLLMSLPLLLIAIFMTKSMGWKDALLACAFGIALTACVVVGAHLVTR